MALLVIYNSYGKKRYKKTPSKLVNQIKMNFEIISVRWSVLACGMCSVRQYLFVWLLCGIFFALIYLVVVRSYDSAHSYINPNKYDFISNEWLIMIKYNVAIVKLHNEIYWPELYDLPATWNNNFT